MAFLHDLVDDVDDDDEIALGIGSYSPAVDNDQAKKAKEKEEELRRIEQAFAESKTTAAVVQHEDVVDDSDICQQLRALAEAHRYQNLCLLIIGRNELKQLEIERDKRLKQLQDEYDAQRSVLEQQYTMKCQTLRSSLSYDDTECQLCLTNAIDREILPCHHQICSECLAAINRTNNIKCPWCRESIMSSIMIPLDT